MHHPTSSSMMNPPSSSAAAGPGKGYPDWVLLDIVARDADSYEEASAGADAMPTIATACFELERKSSTHGAAVVEVEASFRLVDPPEVSCFLVRFRGLAEDERCHAHARVVSAEGNAALIFLSIRYCRARFLVCRASVHGHPTLEVLPYPPGFFSPFDGVGILPRGDGGAGADDGYVVAAMTQTFIDNVFRYELLRYSSETNAWSTKVVSLEDGDCDKDEQRQLFSHRADKVIAVGGSSLGWVDLWLGVLVCDVLNQEDPAVRFFEAPDPMPGSNNDAFVAKFAARSVRDVVCVGDLIKHVEVDYRTDYSWEATAWCQSLSSGEWHHSFTVDTNNIPVSDQRYSYLFPQLWKDGYKMLAVNNYFPSAPTLGMDDDVFYMMAMLDPENPVEWLALST